VPPLELSRNVRDRVERRRWDAKAMIAASDGRRKEKSAGRCDEGNRRVPIWEDSRCVPRRAEVAGEILKSIGLTARVFTTEAQRHGGIGDENPHSRPLRVLEWGTRHSRGYFVGVDGLPGRPAVLDQHRRMS
jgi:hypothetical protein